MRRLTFLAALAAAACGGGGDDTPSTVSISGDVLEFTNEVYGPRILGATVSILEHPEMTLVTGDDAHFQFDGLEPGTDVTLVVEHPDFKTTQTATVTLGAHGIDTFTVQILTTALYDVLANLVPEPPDLEHTCAIATTAARFGGSLYVYMRQGLEGVSATLTPSVSADRGPLYFNEMVIPDPEQPSTSIDGGVLYYRVPPGDYTLSATRGGMAAFNAVRFQCRAGLIVNAGPPMGLNANVPIPDYGASARQPDDEDSASSDAMCEATAACVNQRTGTGAYPAATLASCKKMFKNVWASVDEGCDPDHTFRAAARAAFTCRSSSDCDLVLGGDDACRAEDDAFRAAELTYGACVVAATP